MKTSPGGRARESLRRMERVAACISLRGALPLGLPGQPVQLHQLVAGVLCGSLLRGTAALPLGSQTDPRLHSPGSTLLRRRKKKPNDS